MQPVRQWEGVTPDLFQQQILPAGRPAVLRGIAADWPATKAAQRSDDDIRALILSHHNNTPIPLFEGPSQTNGRLFYNQDMSGLNFAVNRGSLAQFLDRLLALRDHAAPPALYAGALSTRMYLPGFSETNGLDGWLSAVSSVFSTLWIGNRVVVAPHFDNSPSLACVLSGQRRFTLFPLDQIDNLYVGPPDHTPAGQAVSLVQVNDPDLERFPRFAKALESAEQATLEPGDAIFIPALWWHNVESLSPFNVMLNYRWRDVPDYYGNPIDLLMLGLVTLRDLPLEQRLGWRRLFDHYLFRPDDQEPLAHLPQGQRGLFGEPMTSENARWIQGQIAQILARSQGRP